MYFHDYLIIKKYIYFQISLLLFACSFLHIFIFTQKQMSIFVIGLTYIKPCLHFKISMAFKFFDFLGAFLFLLKSK